MKRHSPSAELVTFTPNPIALIWYLWYHQKHGTPLPDPLPPADDEQWAFVLQLLKEDWCGALEFPTFVWNFVLPRSLHAQVRVHRHWSFWSQSHQLHEAGGFASEGDYFEIPDLTPVQKFAEEQAMRDAQIAYEKLRKSGVLPSLARGVLPMHINLGLSAGCSLRSLFKVVVERRCHILQGTYWNPLLEQMKAELVKKVDPRLAEIFTLQPCDVLGRCLSTIEEELRVAGKDPHAVCPRYKELKKTDNASSCCGRGCEGCLKSATAKGQLVERVNFR